MKNSWKDVRRSRKETSKTLYSEKFSLWKLCRFDIIFHKNHWAIPEPFEDLTNFVFSINNLLVLLSVKWEGCQTAPLDLQLNISDNIFFDLFFRTGCEQILGVFEQAYVGKPNCDVPLSAYDPLMTTVPFTHSCNKVNIMLLHLIKKSR